MQLATGFEYNKREKWIIGKKKLGCPFKALKR